MTVNEIMKLTNQKRGTIEQFRSELLKYGLIDNNESLDEKSVGVFEKAIKYKEESSETWIKAMQKAIQEEYGEEMKLPFYWTSNIILKHLIWEIKNGDLEVFNNVSNINNPDFHVIYEVMIDNFKELGEEGGEFEVYNDSFGTDGNPITTYKCIGEDYIYYVVGKYNHTTRNEDIHVFYNDGVKFNIMKCTHICGGNCNKGTLEELQNTCRKYNIN